MEERKSAMRRIFLQRRRSLTAEAVKSKSAEIAARLIALPQFSAAEAVMCYAAMRDEVQTYEIMRQAMARGKRVCIPHIRNGAGAGLMDAVLVDDVSDLVAGKYGILSVRQEKLRAVEPAAIDAVILPGVAFGRRGERLGMGAGFYDRFLPKARHAALLALAFSCQISGEIPVMPYDCFVDSIITEDEVIDCKTGKM